MARRITRGEREVDARLQTLEPSSERYQVLAAARDFKAAWVALGEALTQVREAGSWSAWGYASFEHYCRQELRIRRETAEKLTRSFSFVRDHEPKALTERTVNELPPLEVVDLLSRARERTKVPEEEIETIREEAFEPQSELATRSKVLSRLREIDPEAFRPPSTPDALTRKALHMAEKLQDLLPILRISREARDGVDLAVNELQSRYENVRQSA